MAITPLLKGLRTEGGTFFTFQPAMKDMSLMFSNNENIQFVFSKFVCLKLPEWANVTKQSMYIDPNLIESVNDNSANDNANTFFVKAYLQDYAENLNTIFDSNRDDNNFSNSSELSFLKSFSASNHNENPPLQFEQSGTYLDTDNVVRNVFKEKATSSDYEPIIQYIGDINMVNNAKKNGDEYVEVFGHVPTSAGKIKDVQFIQNLNIIPTIGQIPAQPGEDWIVGQENAYINSNDKSYAAALYDTSTKKYDVASDVDLLKIDWNDLEKPESSSKFDNGNFDFNAVLVYYDIFDKNDQTSVSRNLYGVFIIDSFDLSSPTSAKIPTFTKYQPDENQSGNSYSFRFNLMLSNSSGIVTTSNVINDYSTYSMELYMQALEVLKKIAIEYEKSSKMSIDFSSKISNLETLILSIQSATGEKAALIAAKKANDAANTLMDSEIGEVNVGLTANETSISLNLKFPDVIIGKTYTTSNYEIRYRKINSNKWEKLSVNIL